MIERTYVINCAKCGVYLHDSDQPGGYEICDDCKEKEREAEAEQKLARKEAERELKRIWRKRANDNKDYP